MEKVINIRTLYFLICTLIMLPSAAQKKLQKLPFVPDLPVCYASPEIRKSFIPPPAEFTSRLKSAKPGADIVVNYIGFPDSARIAFEYAVSIWESLIFSPVPIYLQARWQVLANNVLANCGPGDYFMNFEGAPLRDVYYPVALVEKLKGEQITGPGSPDMIARFNSTIPWYFGIDGKTPVTRYDFVSTVLHEIAHGLGFTGFFSVNVARLLGYSGSQNRIPAVYDAFVEDFQGRRLINPSFFPNPSETLYRALTSNLLYSGSFLGKKWNSNNPPRLYAPPTYNDGSSIYHLNGNTYPYGTPNSLMTHSAGRGEAIHSPGPITLGILSDLGWRHLFLEHEPVKDVENVEQPFVFAASVRSDMGLDTASFRVVAAKEGFSADDNIQVQFSYNSQSGNFKAQWLPDIQSGTIIYYITAKDTAGREFTLPRTAPEEFFTITIGTDTIKPVIVHAPPLFVLSTAGSFLIEAVISDNLGIDSAFAIIYKNGEVIGKINLESNGTNNFSGKVDLSRFGLQQGGKLEYKIVATDGAAKPNTRTEPADGTYSVIIEPILQPIAGFFTDFNDGGHDFILGDFSVIRKKNFDSPALHSPNPYPSPNEDNKTFNFVTILRLPIIIKENGIMSFDEVVLVEPGENGTVYGDDEFWDYVIVEASKDYGKNWLPLVNGYDSRANLSWLNMYNSNISGQDSKAIGSKDLFINREISLTGNGNFKAGDTLLIRFRLFSDPYANGWGWAIDNLRIQQPVSALFQQSLSPGHITFWPNPFSDFLNYTYTGGNPLGQVTFEIYDSLGRLLKIITEKGVFPGMQGQLQVADIPQGICIISVKVDHVPVNRIKLVKK